MGLRTIAWDKLKSAKELSSKDACVAKKIGHNYVLHLIFISFKISLQGKACRLHKARGGSRVETDSRKTQKKYSTKGRGLKNFGLPCPFSLSLTWLFSQPWRTSGLFTIKCLTYFSVFLISVWCFVCVSTYFISIQESSSLSYTYTAVCYDNVGDKGGSKGAGGQSPLKRPSKSSSGLWPPKVQRWMHPW